MDVLATIVAALALPPADLLKFCERTSFQGSGPGGQHRNRVYTGVRLEHGATGLRAEASEHREASRNLAAALRRLRLALALRGAHELEDGPDLVEFRHGLPAGWPAFRTKINPEHADFPPCVLLGLGTFLRCGADPKAAAASLDVSTSAMVKFLNTDKAVSRHASEARRAVGLPALH